MPLPDRLTTALSLAREGFFVFPLLPGQKTPGKGMRFKELATRDEATIRGWFTGTESNLAIYTGRYGDNEALVVVDVDVKKNKDGREGILQLEFDGYDFPVTRTHGTPSGGRHIIYRHSQPLRQGVDVLGPGLDIRSRGGFIVACGSTVAQGLYTASADPVAQAPQWLVDRLGVAARSADDLVAGDAGASDTPENIKRATRYLSSDAPLAIEGEGGDATTFRVACRVKDFGVSREQGLQLLAEVWNPKCSPPWELGALEAKVAHAYRYGFEKAGVADPANAFAPVPVTPTSQGPDGRELKEAAGSTPAPGALTDDSPHENLNKEFAYALCGEGDMILWETTDEKGRFALRHLAKATFHDMKAAETITYGNKTLPLTKDWMAWPGRRSYSGIVFMPAKEAPSRFYNLWRGFSCEPLPDGESPTAIAAAAFQKFMDHALTNVCNGDQQLCDWLIGYFAHMVQKPWEKPLVALVFKGGKGVGKNALVERVGDLLGNHFLVAAHNRYLTSNFNGHLENLLFMVLDEAAWAGDKKTEGVLKGLITGSSHVIEHKGEKPYTVDNRTRIAIIGNEDWIVPASNDERRFAVFDVGSGRKQDRAYFQSMREGMAAGGDRLLLRFLRQFDISRLDINGAPATRALLDQKTASLEPVPQWWLACLTEGRIAGGDFEGWPSEANCERVRQAFRRYARERNVRSRLPDDTRFGRELRKACPALGHTRKAEGYVYRVPSLEAARAEWDTHMGFGENWEE
jgi:hypothetical protein